MEQVGGGMNAVIADVLGQLERCRPRCRPTTADTLSAATGELGADQSPADLRKLVEGLIAATREMENRTKSLESELQKSSEQVSELRSKLDDVRKESLTDPLTGIANRKAFDDAVAPPWPAVAETAKRFRC